MKFTNPFKKKKQDFKILSIYGGGLKGFFTAYAIKQLKREYGINLFDEFDMFAGTSIGSFITIAILEDLDFEKVVSYFENDEYGIFEDKLSLLKMFETKLMPRYDNKNVKRLISDLAPDTTVAKYSDKVKKPFIFVSQNYSEGTPAVISSKQFKSLNQRYRNMTVKDAIYSSAAAPFYFEPHKEEYGSMLVDGGLATNNPSLLSVVLAMSDLKVDYTSIKVLSFGQTFGGDNNYEVKKGKELIKDPAANPLSAVINSPLAARQNLDAFLSTAALGDRIFRYQPEKKIEDTSLDYINKEFIDYAKIY